MNKLDEIALNKAMESLPGWQLKDAKITRDFEFKDFKKAFGFMTQIALYAESKNHHPEWSNVYNRLNIQLTTHDVGGISQKDIEMAEYINRIL